MPTAVKTPIAIEIQPFPRDAESLETLLERANVLFAFLQDGPDNFTEAANNMGLLWQQALVGLFLLGNFQQDHPLHPALVATAYDRLLRYVTYHLKPEDLDDHEANEVLNDVLMELLRDYPTLESIAWFFSVRRWFSFKLRFDSRVRDFKRARKPLGLTKCKRNPDNRRYYAPVQIIGLGPFNSEAPDLEEQLLAAESAVAEINRKSTEEGQQTERQSRLPAELEAAMADLSDEEGQLLKLRAVDGLHYSEVARYMGITPATARKRYERLIQKLQRECHKSPNPAE